MEPMNLTGRVTPSVTWRRMSGLRCVMRSAGKRLRSPLFRECRAPIDECSSEAAADSAGQSRRVGRLSGGQSSSSDDCTNALHDGDAQRQWRACNGDAHGGVNAHQVDLVAVVGPCNVSAHRAG
eukprot:4665698-Pleurochrysis_carterae.AAC.1